MTDKQKVEGTEEEKEWRVEEERREMVEAEEGREEVTGSPISCKYTTLYKGLGLRQQNFITSVVFLLCA